MGSNTPPINTQDINKNLSGYNYNNVSLDSNVQQETSNIQTGYSYDTKKSSTPDLSLNNSESETNYIKNEKIPSENTQEQVNTNYKISGNQEVPSITSTPTITSLSSTNISLNNLKDDISTKKISNKPTTTTATTSSSTYHSTATQEKKILSHLLETPNNTLINQFFHLIYWEDKLTTGLLFGCILLFCFLMSIGRFTAVTLICYLVSLQIFICFFYVNGARLWYTFSGDPLPHDQFYSHVDTVRDSLTREQIIDLLRPTSEALHYFASVSLDIVRCSNNTATFSTGVGSFLVGLLGKKLPTHTILSILSIILFTLPILYRKYRVRINSKVLCMLQSINRYLSTIPFLRQHNIRIVSINSQFDTSEPFISN